MPFGLSLSSLGPMLKYGLIAAAIAAAGFWVWHMHATINAQSATIAGLRTDVTKVTALNAENAQATKTALAQAAAANTALQAFLTQSTATSQTVGSQLATIKAAPKTTQSAHVPVLLWDTIQGLKP